MFEWATLTLVQNFGKDPGADPSGENQLEIYLHQEPLGTLLTQSRIHQWLGEGLTMWGSYEDKGDLSSGNIGPYDRKTSKKVWRYNPGDLTLHLATWITATGGAEFGDTTDVVTDDVILSNALALGARVRPVDGSKWAKGQVAFNRASKNGLFRSGVLFWRSGRNS